MSKTKTNNSARCNYWATVVYPESCPVDWLSILESCVVPALVSPLHKFDVNPDGEPKKEHYHVILLFDSLKSPHQAKEIFDKIGGVGCERVNSIRGYARYLCHLDNPDKYQYPLDEVQSFCGCDYIGIISLPTDRLAIIREMQIWIREFKCFNFAELSDYALNEREDWYRVLTESGTVYIKEYMKSCQWGMGTAVRELEYKVKYKELEKRLKELEG